MVDEGHCGIEARDEAGCRDDQISDGGVFQAEPNGGGATDLIGDSFARSTEANGSKNDG